MTEKQIQNAILREFATRQDLRLWRANVGAAKFGDQFVRFGFKGQADLTGLLYDGTRIEIEVKTKVGRLSKDQNNFWSMIDRFNGIYILARNVQDVYEALARKGITKNGSAEQRKRNGNSRT